MILILDAYNILKQVLPTITISEHERKRFIHQLAKYAHVKGHQIVVVFDGGQASWPSQEHHKNVTVVYAGTQRTADDYIKDYLQAHKGKDLLLVSTDRMVCSWAHRMGVQSVDAAPFYRLLQYELSAAGNQARNGSGVTKTTVQENHELDILMQEENGSVPPKTDDYRQQERARAAHKISKKERMMVKKIKKL